MVSLASASDWLLLIVMFLSLDVEDKYLSRPAIVANTISVFITTAHHWDAAGWLLQFYSVLGLPIGFTALVSYLTQKSLDSDFYRFTFIVYHTFLVGLYVILAGIIWA